MNNALILPCAACGTLNRVPRERLDEVPVCASCGEHLLDRAPHDVDAATFDKLVQKSDLPVVVDFWAAWCGPCRMMAPAFAEASKALSGKAILVKLNTEAEPDVAGRYDIRSIPTMVVFLKGRELARTSGAMPAARIVEWVEKAG